MMCNACMYVLLWPDGHTSAAFFGSQPAARDSESIKFDIWVCLKMVSIPKPNGFADHYHPYEKWLFHWED